MRNFFILLKCQAKSLFGLNKRLHSNKKGFFKGVFGVALMLLLIGAAIVYYCYSFINPIFSELQENYYEIFTTIFSLCFLINVFYSFYSAGSVLYGFKDYEMLSSLPVRNSTIVLSKLFTMVISNLLINILAVGTGIYVYIRELGGIESGVLIRVIFLTLLSPFLPIAISALLGFVFTFISSRFKRKNLVNAILLFLFFIAIYVITIIIGQREGLLSIYSKLYFIYYIVNISFSDLLYFLLAVLINVGSFSIVAIFISLTYKKTNSFFTATMGGKKYKFKTYKSRSQLKALFVKELKRLLSCPIYIVNSIISVVLGIFASVFVLILLKDILRLLNLVSDQFLRFMPAFFAFFLLMTPTTACSVSLEGKAFWQVKSLPINYKKYFDAKILLNLLFNGTGGLIVGILFSIGLYSSVLTNGLFILLGLSLAVFGSVLGLLLNLRFTNFEWETYNQVVKSSLSVFLCALCALALSILFVVLPAKVDIPTLYLLIIYNVVFAVANIVLYSVIIKKGPKILDKKQ